MGPEQPFSYPLNRVGSGSGPSLDPTHWQAYESGPPSCPESTWCVESGHSFWISSQKLELRTSSGTRTSGSLSREGSDWNCCSFICSFMSASIWRIWPSNNDVGWTLAAASWGEEDVLGSILLIDSRGEPCPETLLVLPFDETPLWWWLVFLGPSALWKKLF